MRHSPLTIDGLWYCLCPSFRQSYLQHPSLLSDCAKKAPRRFARSASSKSTSSRFASTRSPKYRKTRPESVVPRLRSTPFDVTLSVSTLENILEQYSFRLKTDISRVFGALQVLLRDHHISPTTRHYRAYILANIDLRYGSANNVRSLLQEMEKEGITADSATLHAALESLAVHPSAVLREEVVGALRARWLSLSPAGWHHIILGLLREGQIELALDRLEQMERKGIPLEQWLHCLLVYKLVDLREFPEALHLMRSRSKKSENISPKMWLSILRAAVKNSHFETLRYVWTNAVDLGYTALNQTDCRNVLRLASEYGDIKASESAFRELFTLNQKVNLQDYQKLLQAYALNADIKTALEIICRIHEQKMPLTYESTQPVLSSLEAKMADPEIIWKDIADLQKKGLKIPVALANMLIVYSGIFLRRGGFSRTSAVDFAVQVYKNLFDVCSSGADIGTFNNLFDLCYQSKRPDVCTFFVKEMAALGVIPDQRTLETLILVCLDAKNFRAASMYLADLRARGWELSASLLDEIDKSRREADDSDADSLSQMLE